VDAQQAVAVALVRTDGASAVEAVTDVLAQAARALVRLRDVSEARRRARRERACPARLHAAVGVGRAASGGRIRALRPAQQRAGSRIDERAVAVRRAVE